MEADWKFYSFGKTSVDMRMKGIILPSHDYTVPLHDEKFDNTVAPMWTDKKLENNERHFGTTAWGLPLAIYPYLGESKEHWLSPSNLRQLIGRESVTKDEAADAFDDLNKWVRSKTTGLSQQEKDFFLKTETYKDNPKVPGKTVRYVSETEVEDKENGRHKAVVMYTTSNHSYIVEQARWYNVDGGPPRDPRYKNYLLGDVTNPEAALVWQAGRRVLSVGKDQKEINVFCFTQRPEFLDADQETWKVSQEMLDQRFRICDPKNWNIPTYEEQVEYMLTNYDPAVTIDMIKAACSHRCNFEIPSARPESVRIRSQAASGGDGGNETQQRSEAEREAQYRAETTAQSSSSFAPSGSAPVIPTGDAGNAEVPVSTTSEPTTYRCGRPKQKPEHLTQEQLQKVIDNGDYEGFKVEVSKGQWKPIEESGLVRLPAPEETIPDNDLIPDDDEVPSDDAVPGDAPAPQGNDAPTSEGGNTPGQKCSLEEMHARIFTEPEEFAQLPADKQARANEIVKEAWEATGFGADPELPTKYITMMMDEVLTD